MDLAIESTEGALVDDLATAEKQTDKLRFQASLLQALGQAVVATDTNNVIVFCNQAAEQLFGWAEKEMLRKNVEEAFKDVILENANEICTHTKARKPWTGEAMIKRQNGEFVATILATRPVFEEEKFCGVVGVFTDVSNLKWMQGVLEQAIKAVAELNEKLQVVDSLTRHDIRNKLAALKGRVYLLKKKHCSNQSAALPELVALEECFGQILNILEFQQFYMQLGSEELKEMDVEKSVTEAVELFSDLKNAKLINGCQGLTVLADSLLRQLFYNLMDDSLKYGEKISLIHVYFCEGANQLKLIYEDDGVGMSDEVRAKLFMEGFGRGTGYGLYLIKRICEAYGWTIEETGKEGKGAQFTMTIPKTEKEDKKSYIITKQ